MIKGDRRCSAALTKAVMCSILYLDTCQWAVKFVTDSIVLHDCSQHPVLALLRIGQNLSCSVTFHRHVSYTISLLNKIVKLYWTFTVYVHRSSHLHAKWRLWGNTKIGSLPSLKKCLVSRLMSEKVEMWGSLNHSTNHSQGIYSPRLRFCSSPILLPPLAILHASWPQTSSRQSSLSLLIMNLASKHQFMSLLSVRHA